MAFPDFKNGIIGSWKSDEGFVAEVEIQVNERVSGFVEQHGQHESPGSSTPTSCRFTRSASISAAPISRSNMSTAAISSPPGCRTEFPQSVRRAAKLVEVLARAIHTAHFVENHPQRLEARQYSDDHVGMAKIMDFGLAKCLDGVVEYPTLSDQFLGTPSYTALEQAVAQAAGCEAVREGRCPYRRRGRCLQPGRHPL